MRVSVASSRARRETRAVTGFFCAAGRRQFSNMYRWREPQLALSFGVRCLPQSHANSQSVTQEHHQGDGQLFLACSSPKPLSLTARGQIVVLVLAPLLQATHFPFLGKQPAVHELKAYHAQRFQLNCYLFTSKLHDVGGHAM